MMVIQQLLEHARSNFIFDIRNNNFLLSGILYLTANATMAHMSDALSPNESAATLEAIPQEIAVLVHGTGASDISPSGTRWWQTHGSVVRGLTETFGNSMRVEAFIWSGANNEIDRRVAGEKLARRLLLLRHEGFRCHLIGHSHGGSIIWHAMQWMQHEKIEVDCISSWATVGTPFLTYRLRRGRLLLAGVAAGFGALSVAGFLAPLQGVNLEYAWRDAPIQVLFWSFLLLIPLLGLLWGGQSLWRAFGASERAREANTVRRWSRSEAKQRCLALWSAFDEPIAGLAGSGSFSLRLIQEADLEARNVVGALFSAPRRAVNFVWAALNQIVNTSIARAVQGSSIDYLELRACDPWAAPALAHKPLPPSLDSMLARQADQHAADLGKRARHLLVSGSDPVTGFVDLQRSAAKAVSFKELVHTTYFDEPRILVLLIHHIACNSRLSAHVDPLGPEDHSWYEDRFDSIDPGRAKDPATLPSNRASAIVGCGTVVICVAIGLASFAGRIVHETGFAPTTIRYWLPIAANEFRLATAIVADTSSSVLSKAGFDSARHYSEVDEIDAGTDGISEVSAYLNAFLSPKGISTLAALVRALPSEELRLLFYLRAFPYLFANVPEDVVDVLLSPGLLLPGPNVELRDIWMRGPAGIGEIDRFPSALSEVIFQLSRRNLMTPERFAKLQEHCGSLKLCRERLVVERAFTLAAAGDYEATVAAGPLPPLFGKPIGELQSLQAPADPNELTTLPYVEPETFPAFKSLKAYGRGGMEYGRERAMFWTIQSRNWDYAASFFSSNQNKGDRLEMPWKGISPHLVQTMDTVSEPSALANALLRVAVNANLDDVVPDDVIDSLRKLLPLQVPTDGIRRVTDREFDKFVKYQASRAACRDPRVPVEPGENETSSGFEDKEKRDVCKERLALGETMRGRSGRALIDEALKDTNVRLDKRGGALATIIANRSAMETDEVRARILEDLMARVSSDICNQRIDLQLEPSRNSLLAALRAIYPTPPTTASGTTARLLDYVGGISKGIECSNTIDSTDIDSVRRSFFSLAVPFAKWYLRFLPEKAVRILYFAAPELVPKSQADDSTAFEDTIGLLLDSWNPFYVLDVTQPHADRYGLLRRSAMVQSGICLRAAHAESLADEAFRLAQATDRLGRTVANQDELRRVIELEVAWYVRKADWRNAMNVCRNCGTHSELAALSQVIPAFLTETPPTGPLFGARCQGIEDQHVAQIRKLSASSNGKTSAKSTKGNP